MIGLQEVLDKYLMKSIEIDGVSHNLSVERRGMKGDMELWCIKLDGEEASLFIPSEKDGLLCANGSLYVPTIFAIPPLSEKRRNLLSTSIFAKKLDDFSSFAYPDTFILETPLFKRFSQKEGRITNLWDWIYLTMPLAITEMINLKAYQMLVRKQRPGVRGITTIVRGVHTFISAMMRYYVDEDDLSSQNDSCDLTTVNTLDKQHVVILDPKIVNVDFEEDSPLDFATTSQSKPILIARLKDGVKINDGLAEGEVTFPYASWRRAIVGIRNDDPRRVIVSRSASRSLSLSEPDEPFVTTEHEIGLDSVSLPGVRITHPLTYEDGIVVSKTMAKKMGAFKEYIDKAVVAKDALVSIAKSPLELACTKKELTRIVESICKSDEYNDAPYVVFPGSEIAVVKSQTSNEPIVIRADVPRKCVFVKMETNEFVNDLGVEMIQLKFVFATFLPLMVGDKVADLHGNKCTVAAIVDDSDMPMWIGKANKTKVHYIAPPWVGKRLAVGAAVEDSYAFQGWSRNETIVIDSDDKLAFDEELYRETIGTVVGEIGRFENIPLSLRRMVRLDNNVLEIVGSYRGISFDDTGMVSSRNPKLWTEYAILAGKGCFGLLEFFVRESRVRERFESLEPIFNAVRRTVPKDAQTFEIKQRIPREFLGVGMWSVNEDVFEETAADPRIRTHYGLIKFRRYVIIVPPHEPLRLSGGAYYISPIAIEANRILADIISCNQGYDVSVERAIDRWLEFLARMLKGKDGLVREAMSARAPYAIRSVVVNSNYHDPHTVFVPEKELERLKKDERFNNAYGDLTRIPAILKRDPVHYENHVLGVTVRMWKHAAIGVHPALISALNGDYDGDTVTVMFAPGYEKDIEKLKLTEAINLSKPIKDVDLDNVWFALESRKGMPSSFIQLHPQDEIKDKGFFERARRGEVGLNDIKSAVLDFRKIKDGTALTGALGLEIIFSTKITDKERLRTATSLYHKLAQDTLDAKASRKTPSLDIVRAVRAKDREMLMESAQTLGLSQSEVSLLVEFMSGKIERSLIYAVTRKSAQFKEVANLARNFKSGNFDFILDAIVSNKVLDTIANN